ncbi:hypothetical protein [Rhodococcus qingshengii]|uniref:hypothetical protein n=1 Tax=Rhodococcus TaxID=1827 RepID=UPI001BAEE76D|nr:hypothetical protein [Rhodococcus qingshengii]MBS3693996.1 hypothetical protein [Rhodococcus qingshengii]
MSIGAIAGGWFGGNPGLSPWHALGTFRVRENQARMVVAGAKSIRRAGFTAAAL